MIQALRLEQRLSKEEILTTYLTLTPYGGNIEGIEAACRFYFQKNAARITPSQTALLISLPQSPERRRPDRRHAQAVAARDQFLHRLHKEGLLTAEQVKLGVEQPVPRKRSPTPILAPHLEPAPCFSLRRSGGNQNLIGQATPGAAGSHCSAGPGSSQCRRQEDLGHTGGE